MLIGILEFKSDRFINDVVSRLNSSDVEFISLGLQSAPIERNYRVVVDRLSFSYPFLKEIVKSLSLGGSYVINNPFAASSTNKIIDIKLGSRLGLPFPKTIVLPDRTAVKETGELIAQPDMHEVAEKLGLPCILKPFNGYGWDDVYEVKSFGELQNLYLALSPKYILLAQQQIKFTSYFRVFCFDKQDVLFVKWIPKPQSMGQYLYCQPDSIGDARDRLTSLTIQLNQALDLDTNVMEWCLDEQGQWWVIDAFNEVPEIIPDALPPEYYSWLVDRFVACINDKLSSGKKNRSPFIEL